MTGRIDKPWRIAADIGIEVQIPSVPDGITVEPPPLSWIVVTMPAQTQPHLTVAIVAKLRAKTRVRIGAVVGAGARAERIETIAAQDVAAAVQTLRRAALFIEGVEHAAVGRNRPPTEQTVPRKEGAYWNRCGSSLQAQSGKIKATRKLFYCPCG